MQFHIDSAFLTDIARSWFWNEKMPYEKSEELLMCCLNTDKLSLEEKKAICKDVIEGRKKFVGIDECQIVDDGKNVRTIDEELKKHTRYNAIAAIKTDIACNPFKYLDPFSVNCSYSELAEKIKSGEIENTISDIEDYLLNYHEVKEDDVLNCGMWLWQRPEFITDICDASKIPEGNSPLVAYKDGFWRYIYVALKKKGTHKPSVLRRQNRYLVFIGEKPKTLFNSEFGLISPKGEWFDCGFAEHNSTAAKIIHSTKGHFGLTKEQAFRYYGSDRCLDFLFDRGWAALRNPEFGRAYDFWKGDDEESVEWAVFEVTTDKPFFLLSYEEYESIELTGFYDSFDEAFEEMKELIAESVNDVFDEDATADDVEDMEDYNVFVHSNKDSKDSGAPLAFASFCDDYPNREWTIFHI